MMKFIFVRLLIFIALLSSECEAAVMVLQNRLIIHRENVRNKLLLVNNSAMVPVLVKAWIDDGDETNNKQSQAYPFLVVPSLLKLEPNQLYNIEILPTRLMAKLPTDRESLFWINLFEIAGEHTDNSVNSQTRAIKVGLNSQLKLIYRPFTEDDCLDDINQKLSFSIEKTEALSHLTITNSSRHVVTPAEIELVSATGSTRVELGFDRDIQPFSERKYRIKSTTDSAYLQIKYSLLDDYSQSHAFTSTVNN